MLKAKPEVCVRIDMVQSPAEQSTPRGQGACSPRVSVGQVVSEWGSRGK